MLKLNIVKVDNKHQHLKVREKNIISKEINFVINYGILEAEICVDFTLNLSNNSTEIRYIVGTNKDGKVLINDTSFDSFFSENDFFSKIKYKLIELINIQSDLLTLYKHYIHDMFYSLINDSFTIDNLKFYFEDSNTLIFNFLFNKINCEAFIINNETTSFVLHFKDVKYNYYIHFDSFLKLNRINNEKFTNKILNEKSIRLKLIFQKGKFKTE